VAAGIRAAYHVRELAKIQENQPRPELIQGKVQLDGQGSPVAGLPDGFIEVDPATGQPPAPTIDQFPTISPRRHRTRVSARPRRTACRSLRTCPLPPRSSTTARPAVWSAVAASPAG